MTPMWLTQLAFDWRLWNLPFTQFWQETVCAMLVGMACGLLGCFVVLRRMALIGDALSHAILPGVIIAFLLTGSNGPIGLVIGAMVAGLVTAVLINLVSRFSRAKEDSAIGIVFTAFFAVGIILYGAMETGTHFDLKCFLFGDVLAVRQSDLLLMVIVAPVVIAAVVLFYHPLRLISFDPVAAAAMGVPVALFHYLLMGLLSATVVAGLTTTGVILVVAMVITPASAAYQLTNRFSMMLILSTIFGAVSAAVGVSVAFVTNFAPGPAIVLVAAFIFVIAMVFSPAHGIVFDRIRRRRLNRHIAAEDVLKALFHLREGDRRRVAPNAPIIDRIAQVTHLSLGKIQRTISRLRSQSLVALGPDGEELTAQGRNRAREMVRAHRLWESYLVEHANLNPDEIHDQAEILEHAHELADEVDAMLGHPKRDPHGEEIPSLPSPKSN